MPSQETESSLFGPLASFGPELREQLIIEHLPQVKQIALEIHQSVSTSVALDDLISAGVIGLITAIDGYEPRSAVELKIYAQHKIRQAILDSLRHIDWFSRQQRTRAKLIEAAIFALEQQRPMPAEEEIAALLHLSVAEYREWLSGSLKFVSGTAETAQQESDHPNSFSDVAASEDQRTTQTVAKDASKAMARDKCPISKQISGRPSTAPSVLSTDVVQERTVLDDLSQTEAGRYARSLIEDPIVQILMAAASAFQEFETGRSWLLTPSLSLGNLAPISLISSQTGREIVANELGLIEHGMF